MKSPRQLLSILVMSILPFLGHSQVQPRYSFGIKKTGHGKPIIFIPGNNGSGDTYNTTIAVLEKKYTCYVLTLAGFAGQPPIPNCDTPLARQKKEILLLIKDAKMDRPAITGFSFGATMALWIATEAPDAIGPVISIDGIPYEDIIETPLANPDSLIQKTNTRYERARLAPPSRWAFIDSTRKTPPSIAQGFEDLTKLMSDTNRIHEVIHWDTLTDRRSSALMNLELERLDLRSSVAHIHTPILVLGSWQGWDSLHTKQDAEKAYALQYKTAPNVTIVFSEKGKHFLMWEDYDWYISQCSNFLDRTYPR